MDYLQKKQFAALSYRDFRLLWLGLLVSNMGSQMQVVALNWHLYLLTKSPLALGLLGLSRFLPLLVFSLIGGVYSDANNRKKILLVTQTILTILALILAFMTFTGQTTPMLIYIITILSSATMAFDTPARQAFTPSLVHRNDLANAMSLNSIMFQTSMVIGPALGGFLIASTNISAVYAFNSISFVAVIGALLLMHATGDIVGQKVEMSFASIKEGIFFVKSKTILWGTMLLDFTGTALCSVNAIMPVFADKILHVGPMGLGLLYAAPSAGAVLAGLYIAYKHTITHEGKVIIASVTIYALATIIFGISQIFWLSLIALFIVGAADSTSTIIRNTIRQLVTPDHLRGRMIAINMTCFMGGPQVGDLRAGVTASLIGAGPAVAIGGIVTTLLVTLIGRSLPALRNYSTKLHQTL